MQMQTPTEAELKFMLDAISEEWFCNLSILIYFYCIKEEKWSMEQKQTTAFYTTQPIFLLKM